MRGLKKWLSMLLIAVLMFNMSGQALAVMMGAPQASNIVVRDENGNVIEEDWETAFPYGTFVLEKSEVTLTEGGAEQRVKVYRLGGTIGRATAKFQLAPAAAQSGEDEISYINAAGKSDYAVKVEDTLPVAAYQPVGREADPLASGVQVGIDEARCTADTVDAETGEITAYGDVVLYADVDAQAYQWYAYSAQSGRWTKIDGATEKELMIDTSMVEGFNYRCVYTQNNTRFSTDGLAGYTYAPYEEDLEPMPDNLELNPEQTFSTLVMDGGEFDAYEFSMTFAEGEWVKEIIIQANGDEEVEADEFAALRIVDCLGGSVYDTANTLAIHIAASGETEAGPTYISFDKTEYTFDKSGLKARLTLNRTGDLTQFVTVGYRTVEGTASEGDDFAAVTEGVAAFPSGLSSVDIEIDLVNDGVLIEEADRAFAVELTGLLGGAEGSAILEDTARVNLYNSASEAEAVNAATMLYTQGADDLSSIVTDTAAGLVKKEETPAIVPVEHETIAPLEADVHFGADASGEIAPMTYHYGTINFSRTSGYTSNYWQDWAKLAQHNGTYNSYDANDVEGYMSSSGNWSGAMERFGNRWRVVSEQTASGTFTEADFTERFDYFKGAFTYDADQVSGWSTKTGASDPYVKLVTGGAGGSEQISKAVTSFYTSGLFGVNRHMSYKTGETLNWNIGGTNGGSLTIGIGRRGGSDWDAHGVVWMDDAVLRRRVLSNDMQLVIHTADDDAIKASTVKDTLYNGIKPTVDLVARESGVNSWGRVYVGSKLTVTPAVSGAYQLAAASDGKLGQSIYLASGTSAKVNDALNTATVSDGSGTLVIKTASTDNNLSTSGSYSVNVVLDRVQALEFDLSPSVPRKTVNGAVTSEIDPDQVAATVSDFWNKANITYTYAVFDPSASGNYRNESGRITSATASGAILALSNVKNLKTINFGLPSECMIGFNGNSYAGNETIDIPVGRYTSGKLSFLYYAPEFITAENDMRMSISHIERYFDMNGNGKLDGYYDAGTGLFILEEVNGVKDVLVDVIEEKDYTITNFEPVYADTDGDGKGDKYVEQFFKTYYTMTPKCLVTPTGTNEKDPAQVLPVFTTNITNESVKSKLTEELQGYRFITSGMYSKTYSIVKNGGDWATVAGADAGAVTTKTAGAYSGDGKLMYTMSANMLEQVDTPLGGNTNPISYAWNSAANEPLLDANGDYYYRMEDWNPQYINNLLYSFSDPAPIFIDNTPLGDFIPVSSADDTAPQGYDVSKLNNYLGSYNANDTVLFGVREQTQTTAEIKGLQGLESFDSEVVVDGKVIKLDTVNDTGTGTIPGNDNLRRMTAQDDDANTQSGADTSGSSNSMSEMNVDMGVELPTMEFGLSDYITIIMDGYEVGFSIGVPLFKAESKTQAYTSEMTSDDEARKFKSEKSSPINENKEALSQIKDAFTNPASLLNDDDWKDVKETQGVAAPGEKSIRAKSMSVEISFNVTILFKYNSLDNKYVFSQAMFAVSAGLEFKFTARLTVCPILYAYFVIGLEVEMAGGVIVDRVVDLYPESSHTMNFSSGDDWAGTGTWQRDTSDTSAYKGDKLVGDALSTLTVPVTSDTFQITFSGKLGVQNASGFEEFEGGYVTSDGSEPVVVKLDSYVTGKGSGSVKLIALEAGTSIDKIEQVKAIRNDTYFSGITLSPSLFLEVGVGIGVEVLKAELYFKASIGCTMTFAKRVEDEENGGYKTEAFSFDSMEFRAGIGVRVVLLLFSFELDAIQFGIDYRKELDEDRPGYTGETSSKGFNKKGWKFAWYALNGMEEFDADEGDGFPGVRISVPANSYYAQQIFGPEDGNSILEQLQEMAYDPTDPAAPFQLSGYSTSSDAFKLSEELVSGTDYQLVTVGTGSAQKNYLVYTVSRDPADIDNSVDANLLVMSEVVNTGSKVGLYKPGTNDRGYIIVDSDDTGDLDFAAWADGNKVYATWVSYASASAAAPQPGVEPGVAKYPGMTEENYNTIAAPTPVAPAAEPDRNDYYYTIAPDTTEYPVEGYDTLAEAKRAYETAYEKWSLYDAYLDSKQSYDEWKAYYASGVVYDNYIQNQLKNAAKNTAVKTAFCDVTAVSPVFGSPYTIASDTQPVGYKFSPQIASGGSIIFYASSREMTQAERDAANARHQADYDAATGGVTVERDGAYSTATEGDPTAPFRLAYNQSMDDVYGQNTVFNFAVKDSAGVYHPYAWTPDGWAASGMRLENVAMTMIDSANFYIAYTASKEQAGTDGKSATVRFLYLQKGTISADGTLTLDNAKVLRKLYDAASGANAADFGLTALTSGTSAYTGMDGVYNKAGIQTEAYEDPYFANVRFLQGKLGALTGQTETFDEELAGGLEALDAQKEDFLLFEMNGNTYVVPQASLAGITGATGTGMIIPFFDKADAALNATRGNMTIGADAEGNISAVYTDTVPNTTNNAIYVVKYDAGNGADIKPSWGEGRMLAMNAMQVYENAREQGLSAEEAEAAYYELPDGNMTSFVFSNLEIALGYKNALEGMGLESFETSTSTMADGTVVADQVMTLTEEQAGGLTPFGDGDTPPASDSTLLIIAQGTQTKLTREEYAGDASYQIVVPERDESGSIISSTGYYAISFGVGEQSIGEGRITFDENNFVPDAKLIPTITFKNTGDVPLRGSKSNPIMVSLSICDPDGNNAESLASWKIEGSIPVGKTITTYSETSQVYTSALPAGDPVKGLEGYQFYFTVSEDGDYVGEGAYTYDSRTVNEKTGKTGAVVKVEKLPELAVEDVKLRTQGVEGDKVVIGLDLKATNRGAADAAHTYLQFTYQTGVDANGDPIYAPINLNGHNLEISEQKPIEALSASSSAELTKGILRLHGRDGTDDLKMGYGRLVDGTFTMTKDAYCAATITGSLNIRVEIFYQDALEELTLESTGYTRSNHAGELNGGNNSQLFQLEAETFFTAPSKIRVAVGTTTRLYVPAVTTRETKPVITVSELSTTLDEVETKHIGILYYNDEGGYLAITPKSEGEGVIRVADTETNSFIDIAFTTTAAGEGVNIFNDNDIFTYYDTSGSKYTSDTVGSHKDDWKFNTQQLSWGDGDVPYLYDLAVAKRGASFTLETMADKITLFFEGDITVESDLPGFEAKQLNYSQSTASVKNGVEIDFENGDSTPHTVKITVRSDTATFDKYHEAYGPGGVPLPSDDKNAPHIYWSRNMPGTATVAQDGKVAITVYVIDDSGLAAVTLDGRSVKELGDAVKFRQHTNTFWQFEVEKDANENFTVIASDTAANKTNRAITVDWFKVTSGAGTDSALALDAHFAYEDGSPVTGTSFINEMIYLNHTAIEPTDTIVLEKWDSDLPGFVDTQLTSQQDRFSIAANGLYRITRTADDGTFASAVLLMNRLDPAKPEIRILKNADGVLRYQVVKVDGEGEILPSDTHGVAPIASVSINGVAQEIPAGSINVIQNFATNFNGKYRIEAEDEAGNEAYFVDAVVSGRAVDLSAEGFARTTASWNQEQNTGELAVDTAKALGGYYDQELFAAETLYAGSYLLAVVPRGTAVTDADFTAQAVTNAVYTFTDLAPGEYDLYVRDALGTGKINQAVHAFTIGDDKINVSAQAKKASTRSRNNGQVKLIADGGITGDYLFAIYKVDTLLHPDENDLSWFDHTRDIGLPTYHDEQITVEVENPDYISEEETPGIPPVIEQQQTVSVLDTNIGVWFEADDTAALVKTATFEDLYQGRYIIVVRDADDSVYEACTASTSVSQITVPFGNSGLGLGGIGEEPEVTGGVVQTDEAVYVILDETYQKLTDADETKVEKLNASKDVIISGLGVNVIVPAGTLKAGDGVNTIFTGIIGKSSDDGDVVVCTDSEGERHIIIYSVVGDEVFYIASIPGTYSVITNAKAFDDVAGHWAKSDIDFISARELFNGVGNDLFAPDDQMTRAMFVTVLHRLDGKPAAGAEAAITFDDVPEDIWYTEAVRWASANGIVNGYDEKTFGPDDKISREQMCAILARYMNYAGITLPAEDGDMSVFVDADDISKYALEAVESCRKAGLVNGVGGGRFDPQGDATRGQVAAIFARFIKKVVTKD